MASQTPVLLPRPIRFRASGVSLYGKGKEVSADLDTDFFAIVGANGLGKSTLLNLILYAITGAVRIPNSDVDIEKDARGFLAKSSAHAPSYFEGRVERTRKEAPWVEVAFELGKHRVVVRRSFFGAESVTSFSVDNKNQTAPAGQSIDAAYKTTVSRLAHLASFEQFAFFVFTVQYFGEDHFCLFWDQVALNLVVATIIGASADEGERLGELFEEFKRHDSHVRNLQWQITTEKKLLKEIAATSTQKSVPKSVIQKYENTLELIEQLRTRLAELAESRSERQARRDDAQLGVDEVRRKLEAQTWAALAKRRIPLARSPILQQLSSDLTCPLCRTVHEQLPPVIQTSVKDSECPLCRANVAVKGDTSAFDNALKQLGSERTAAEDKLAKRQDEFEATVESYERCREDLRRADEALEKLEASYRREMLEAALALKKDGLSTNRLTELEHKIETLTTRKEDHRTKREAISKKLAKAQESLLEGFERIRGDLVPRFQKLAREFLGLPLTLSARTKKLDSMPIVEFHVAISGTDRRRPEQLSESQRFFLDIALRMTILSWVAQSRWSPFLALDTPEGALDIAYETNAGTMFGLFLSEHEGTLLTASNLNSSRLIRKTLEICRDAKREVKLLDLRDWAQTTGVQNDHKQLMDDQINELRKLASN